MNMVAKLYVDKARDQYINSVTLPDGQSLAINKGICKEFCDYLQKLNSMHI